MKAKFFFFVLLISLLGFSQVKADTITLNLPGSGQYCQDLMSYDTFVFHKPIGFGSTMWYIDFTPVGSGDSIVYIPSSPGDHVISATWNSNSENYMLSLYTQVPPSPTFDVYFGGQINITRDTAWMCTPPIQLLADGVNGSDCIYAQWSGPGGNIAGSSPIITVPGTYYYERGNTCGVTIDSIEVIALPTQAPVWNDTTFCNLAVSLILDAGPGWNYDWNTTEITQTIDVTSAGTYIVQLTNVCTNTSASITVEEETYPMPDLDLYSQIPSSILCQNEVAILDPYSAGHTYDTYQWYQGTTPIGNQATLTVDYVLGDGHYLVEVTQGNCSETSEAWISFYQDPIAPAHCVSTFDPLTGTNMTVIEAAPDFDVTDYILAYKQGVNWINIDTVSENGSSSYTLYDNINDPNQQSQKYAVFSRHTCGHLSPLEDWHKTIRIGIFQDIITGDYILQILDDYETLSGYAPSSYTIWIDSLNNGNFTDIGLLNGGNTSFTITSPVNGAAYYASVNLPWNCGGTKSYPVAFSNKRLFNITEINDMSMSSSISLYPNPSTGMFSVKGENISLVEVKDMRGSLILRTTKTTDIDLSAYSSGIYVVTVSIDQGSINLKFFLE